MRLLYFAWLRERLGRAEEELPLPASVTTVGELRLWLAAREAARGSTFGEPGVIRAAVNQEIAGPETRLSDGDEVAFFPPMTGG
ncbi:MAG: molybdopterin converting factor subunit 1 [Acetobacteraceae bacterium]